MLRAFRKLRLGRLMLTGMFILATLTTSASLFVEKAKAANFQMQTGYYVGTNAPMNIRGLGFQPEMLILRTSVGSRPIFKTSAMPANTVGYLDSTALNTASLITFTPDGFDVASGNAGVNGTAVLFHWSAYAGSDCTSSGSFCVSSYTGNAQTSRLIQTGFEPSLAIVRRNGSFETHYRTASMPTGTSQYFSTTASNTAGAFISSFDSNGFNIGISDNTNSTIFYYAAFKKVAGIMNEGTYAGDGTDDRNITGIGFKPSSLFVKNDTSATATNRVSVMANDQTAQGVTAYAGSTTANVVADSIQKLQSDGFQVGTSAFVNELGSTQYWFAMGGAVQPPGTGTFTMATGTYAGDGLSRVVSGVGFRPDLVIIKDGVSTSAMVYRTSVMVTSAYVGAATADQSVISSLESDGFGISNSAIVNSTGRTYHWQAFGNAYKPETKSGAADFAVGAYQPTGIDNTYIPGAPMQLDFIHIKQAAAQSGVFRTSNQVGDTTGLLTAAPETSNAIQYIDSTGFEVGTNSTVNVIGANYRWFGFKSSANFSVGSYTGDGTDNRIVTIGSGMNPDLILIKQAAGAAAITRPSTITTDLTHYVLGTAPAAGRIKATTGTGITVGTVFEVNTLSETYRYAAWKKPVSLGTLTGDIVDASGTSVSNPAFAMSATGFPYSCSSSTGTLGTSSQKIRIRNTTSNAPWTVSIAATNGATATWSNSGNTRQYDFNDPTGSPAGCSDGGDADSLAGKLRIEPVGATLTPQSGCTTGNITLGSNQNFNQGVTDSITLATASAGTQTGCYWDITGINMEQYIPENQPSDTYNLNLTVTTIAS